MATVKHRIVVEAEGRVAKAHRDGRTSEAQGVTKLERPARVKKEKPVREPRRIVPLTADEEQAAIAAESKPEVKTKRPRKPTLLQTSAPLDMGDGTTIPNAFHAPIGSVQIGDGTTTTVQQTIVEEPADEDTLPGIGTEPPEQTGQE